MAWWRVQRRFMKMMQRLLRWPLKGHEDGAYLVWNNLGQWRVGSVEYLARYIPEKIMPYASTAIPLSMLADRKQSSHWRC